VLQTRLVFHLELGEGEWV